MDSTNLHIDAIVGEDRRVVIDLLSDFPIGPVALDIHAVVDRPGEASLSEPSTKPPLTREEVRQRLLAAGLLSTTRYAPEGATHSSPEDRERLAALFANKEQSTLDLINLERGQKG